ncbi:MAG: EAL domain-containing protein [Pseudonocardiaceae bacterium]
MGEHHTDVAGEQENNSPSAALAREWTRALITASYVPMAPSDIRHYVRDLTQRLVTALSGPSVDTQAASDVGARLVAGGFTGTQSLPRTFEVLGRGLPAACSAAPGEPPPSCGRIIELLGALAAGYTWALRDHVVHQQEEIKRALSLAWQDVERKLRASEARLREALDDLPLLEQRLSYQSLHDLQTGLPNRQYLRTHLEKVLALHEPSAVVTLLHLDLDGFSAITDGLGYQTGDQLLDVVARRLEAVVAGRPAMVARLGNDEYAILLEPEDPVPDAGALTEIINTELAKPFPIDGIGVAVTATVGVVQRRVAGTKPEELIRAASATLRRIRARATRQWTLFDPDVDAADRTELRLAATMPGALQTGELHVTYQPVVTLQDHRLVRIETALRWQHPQLGELSGEQCMQAAERTGVVHDVSQWLLRTAAEQAMSWRQRIGDHIPPVVVNLTPSQAQDPDLVARVQAVLDETGLTAAALELRAPAAAIRTVTGELAGVGGRHAEDNVRVLTGLGVRAGLYDFGGGIGALRCLADLSLRTVRIAPPISQQVADDPSRILSQAAQALVHIVRAAGIDVVAFPVDSAEQAACWPWIGANWALGALFGTPGPPVSVEPWLNADP